MDTDQFQNDFLSQVQNPLELSSLFDHIPDVFFFAKNRDSQFVTGNSHFMTMLGINTIHDAIAKTDLDFFDDRVAGEYISEDRYVMETNRPLPNQLWLVPNLSLGTVSWYRCTKMPVHSRSGSVVGLAGVLKDIAPDNMTQHVQGGRMVKVLDFITKNYRRNISLEELASVGNLSVSQFQRKFQSIFHVSPMKYLIKFRIDAACRELRLTNRILTDIALDLGFCDHSHFCRQFRKHTGMSPGKYRETRGINAG